MQEMIKKILEIDEKARKLTDEANALKLQTELSIDEKKQQLKDSYLDRARKKIDILRDTEIGLSNKEYEKITDDQARVLETLSEAFAKNADKWVGNIVSNCTNADN